MYVLSFYHNFHDLPVFYKPDAVIIIKYTSLIYIGNLWKGEKTMYKQDYLQTWVIAICFALSFLIIPAIVGLVLLFMRHLENKKLIQKYGTYDQLDGYIANMRSTVSEMTNTANKLNSDIEQLKHTKEDIETNNELDELVKSFDYSSFDSYSSEECKNKLAIMKQEEKQLLKDNKAVSAVYEGPKKQLNNYIKQIIRCFNSECDNITLSVSVKNIESLRNKISKSFDTINALFKNNGVQLTIDLLEYKLKELTLLYEYEQKYQQEKEIQKAIREQMVEEEKARKELEKREAEIEKDEKQFNKEISKMMKYLQKADNDVEKQIYADKIKELEEKLKTLEIEKADVINRRQNAKAGFVYIISNIGSFGEDVYKIGMTRRLEPMDRIKELSSASVPFEFDVHAMIFSEDAPALEASLHSHFDKNRVNKINPRKEFFKVKVDEIEKFVDDTFDKTVQFTKIPVAKEYRDTLSLLNA